MNVSLARGAHSANTPWRARLASPPADSNRPSSPSPSPIHSSQPCPAHPLSVPSFPLPPPASSPPSLRLTLSEGNWAMDCGNGSNVGPTRSPTRSTEEGRPPGSAPQQVRRPAPPALRLPRTWLLTCCRPSPSPRLNPHLNSSRSLASSFCRRPAPPPRDWKRASEPSPDHPRPSHCSPRIRPPLLPVPKENFVVKYQTIVREEQEIVVGRVKVPTVRPPSRPSFRRLPRLARRAPRPLPASHYRHPHRLPRAEPLGLETPADALPTFAPPCFPFDVPVVRLASGPAAGPRPP